MSPSDPHRARALAGLAASPIFANLPATTSERFLDECRFEALPRRMSVSSTLKTSPQLSILISGRLLVARTRPQSGRQISLFLLGPGDIFDLVSLLDGPLPITAEALDPVEVLSIEHTTVLEWLARDSAFALAALAYLARQLRDSMELSAELALYGADERLARLLLRHAEGEGEGLPRNIHDLPHEVLAGLVGSVRVVTNRHLQTFKQEGLVDFRRGRIEILDVEGLRQRAEEKSKP